MARVAVNRQWQAFFGRGFVRSLEDFGYQSEAPTHPELLDTLAVRFMESGWSTKWLHREIVTSRTWRQSSAVTQAAAGIVAAQLASVVAPFVYFRRKGWLA